MSYSGWRWEMMGGVLGFRISRPQEGMLEGAMRLRLRQNSDKAVMNW